MINDIGKNTKQRYVFARNLINEGKTDDEIVEQFKNNEVFKEDFNEATTRYWIKIARNSLQGKTSYHS